jgi:hypothetical protein
VIEQRYADGAYDRLRGLVMELVRSNVDVIVVDGTAAAKALNLLRQAGLPPTVRACPTFSVKRLATWIKF